MLHGKDVTSFELSPLVGQYRKTYTFVIGPPAPGSSCPDRIASVGSCSDMVDKSLPSGRWCHFDVDESRFHATIWMKDRLPDYQQVRQDVVDRF